LVLNLVHTNWISLLLLLLLLLPAVSRSSRQVQELNMLCPCT
jgi:hypothetical protein